MRARSQHSEHAHASTPGVSYRQQVLTTRHLQQRAIFRASAGTIFIPIRDTVACLAQLVLNLNIARHSIRVAGTTFHFNQRLRVASRSGSRACLLHRASTCMRQTSPSRLNASAAARAAPQQRHACLLQHRASTPQRARASAHRSGTPTLAHPNPDRTEPKYWRLPPVLAPLRP